MDCLRFMVWVFIGESNEGGENDCGLHIAFWAKEFRRELAT